MKVQVLVDNINSWYIPYAKLLVEDIKHLYDVKLLHNHNEVEHGDVLCLLACEKVFTKLDLNKNNIVVHESDLPLGRGWSPLTWQILEKKNKIPITLFEANQEVDSGVIYYKEYIELEGTELLHEIKHKQGEITNNLIKIFLSNYPNNVGVEQSGVPSYYRKRLPKDSELDINKSISEQFNLLRVIDNERYPAFFYIDNKKFVIKIHKEDE